MRKLRTKTGFTIVELLIVIVVIAILATIATAAYSNMQARARDSIRKQDLATIAQALKLYNIDKGDWMGSGSGCGYSGQGWGWYNHKNSTHNSYASGSISDCLVQSGKLQDEIVDPSGDWSATPTEGFSYMKFNCTVDEEERVFLFAKLETVPQNSTATNNTCTSSSGFDSSYGMNYFVRVN